MLWGCFASGTGVTGCIKGKDEIRRSPRHFGVKCVKRFEAKALGRSGQRPRVNIQRLKREKTDCFNLPSVLTQISLKKLRRELKSAAAKRDSCRLQRARTHSNGRLTETTSRQGEEASRKLQKHSLGAIVFKGSATKYQLRTPVIASWVHFVFVLCHYHTSFVFLF